LNPDFPLGDFNYFGETAVIAVAGVNGLFKVSHFRS